tara:strand:- start:907 stop:1620 length:714 start_codon:yes stop_codon:yes gene_type:complete
MKMGMGMPIPDLSNLPGPSRPGGGGGTPPAPPFPNTKSLLLPTSGAVANTNNNGWGTSYTWSVWINLTTSSGYSVAYSSNAVVPYLSAFDNGTATKIVYGHTNGEFTSNTAINTGSWNHIVLRKTSGTINFFINGQPDSSTGTDSDTYAANIAVIGGLPSYVGTGFGLIGNLDEFSTYDYALSSTQIASIWNGGTPTDVSSLNPINWWRFEDNGNDSGSGNNPATLVNGATYSSLVP